MSQWVDRIKSSSVWSRLESLDAAVKAASGADQAPESREDLERIGTATSYISAMLAGIDPVLLVPQMLAPLDQPLVNIQAELAAFRANGNRQHLLNANAQLDGLLVGAYQISRPINDSSMIGATTSIESVRAAAESAIQSLSASGSKVADQLKVLDNEIKTLAPTVESQKARLDTAISTNQSQFSTAQEQRSRDFEELRQQLSEQFKNWEADQKEQGSSILSSLSDMREKAQNLLHIIGNTGMSGEYAKTANVNRRLSIGLQGLAFLALGGLVGFAIYAYNGIQGASVDVAHTLGRVFVAATFGVLAAYASRQADFFQRYEERNRRLQLILSSIDPYLASLPEHDRNPVKVELAKALFGQPGMETSVVTDKSFDGNAADFLKLLTQLAEAFSKSK